MTLSLTILIIAITAITSFLAFNNPKLEDDLIFDPIAVSRRKQWYRFITCGFIHADFTHLLFNMMSFYFFGQTQKGDANHLDVVGVEDSFIGLFGDKGKALYLLLYISALVICLLPTYFKHKNNSRYKSLGASGAVSAIIFVGIFIAPQHDLVLFLLPIPIPGFIFGPLYLFASAWMAKRGKDNINHSAHFWGALYGVIFFAIASFALTSFNPLTNFVEKVSEYFRNF